MTTEELWHQCLRVEVTPISLESLRDRHRELHRSRQPRFLFMDVESQRTMMEADWFRFLCDWFHDRSRVERGLFGTMLGMEVWVDHSGKLVRGMYIGALNLVD